MPLSQGFQELFYDSRPLLRAEELLDIKNRLFLPDGSPHAFVEAYSLPSKQASDSRGLRAQQHGVRQHKAFDLTSALPHANDESGDRFTLTVLRTPEAVHAFGAEASESQVYLLRQRHSYSVLSLSAGLYETLVLSRSITPSFLSFLRYLGERDSEVEVIPSAPRLRLRRATGGGHGVSLEIMMGVRFIEMHGRADRSMLSARWSMRQSVVYLSGGESLTNSTCVFVTPSKALQTSLSLYLPTCSILDIACVIELQLLILESAISTWRPYIIDLTAEAEMHAAQVLGATPDDSGPMTMSNAGERQSLMILSDKVHNALSALQHTKEILVAIVEEYESIQHAGEVQMCGDMLPVFRTISNESDVLILRLKALQTRLQGVANIVSSFLELSSGYALQQLTRESRRENAAMRQLSQRMHNLTEKATQDAVAVKVLTIMTMIYLPATVVSNFFSTSFVSTTGDNHIFILNDWWIFIATSVPLTVFTLYVWLVWVRIQAHHIYPWWWLATKKNAGTKGHIPGPDEENRDGDPGFKQT